MDVARGPIRVSFAHERPTFSYLRFILYSGCTLPVSAFASFIVLLFPHQFCFGFVRVIGMFGLTHLSMFGNFCLHRLTDIR